jgi:hypothetical protein
MDARLTLTAVAAVAFIVAAADLPAADATQGGDTAKQLADPSASPKPSLQKGMDAATVIRLVGRPVQIKSIKSPDGNAETWIYRRLLSRTVTQEPTRTRDVPAFDGTYNDKMGTRSEIVYSNVAVETYQVTHLLMFNDQLVMAKQWREQTRSFDH